MAEKISGGRIVGWFQDRIEFGDMFITAFNDAAVSTIKHPDYIKQPIEKLEKVSD